MALFCNLHHSEKVLATNDFKGMYRSQEVHHEKYFDLGIYYQVKTIEANCDGAP